MRQALLILAASAAIAASAHDNCCGASCPAATAIVPARISAPDGSPLSLAWADEFRGDSLDRSVWNVEVNGSGCGNHELQYYVDSPGNIAVRDGNLVITARREDHDGHAFTSGRLNTLGKFAFTYGLVEARVLLPDTRDGLWPAVWFMGSDISDASWPRCGEIDLLEMGHADGIAGGSQRHLFNGAIHYGPDEASHHQQVGVGNPRAAIQDGRYHSFFLWWTPEAISMYVDSLDTPYLTIATSATSDVSDPGFYFNKPAFVLINLAVGGDFTGIHNPDDITALPSDGASRDLLIDYIRIYTPDNQLSQQ